MIKQSASINQWMDYIQTLHAREIELTLDRVSQVFDRLCPEGVPFKVITVAGTNGKGSTSEIISAICRAAGHRVGKYSSPHILNYNERVSINGADVADANLINAFQVIEQLRGDIPLTFFEFGTLVAIHLFLEANLDLVVMEVGLGGRLDATNILAADVAVVTSIGIDHTAWLGDTLEKISAEKIAIAKSGRPCVVGLSKPTAAMSNYCNVHNVELHYFSEHFEIHHNKQNDHWTWLSSDKQIKALPLPFGQANQQLGNAAVAIKAISLLKGFALPSDAQIRNGISNASLRGRCQLVSRQPNIVLDVAHNVESIANLRTFVESLKVKGRVYAVCGMLNDKQITESLQQLIGVVDEWHFGTINNARGATASEIDSLLRNSNPHQLDSFCHNSVAVAFTACKTKLTNDDCLIVFGSFFVVSDIITRV